MTDIRVPVWSGLAQPLSPAEIAEYESRFADFEYSGGNEHVQWPSEREQTAQ